MGSHPDIQYLGVETDPGVGAVHVACGCRSLVSCLTNGWCFAARDFRVRRGASDEQTRRGL